MIREASGDRGGRPDVGIGREGERGTISGSFDLTPEQVQYLKQGKLYIQINSEKAPDGTLWGWLLK